MGFGNFFPYFVIGQVATQTLKFALLYSGNLDLIFFSTTAILWDLGQITYPIVL